MSMSDALVRITDLATLLQKSISAVAALTAELAAEKETQRRLEEEDLPELMRELTLTEIKLENGSSVKVVDDLTCGISEERRYAAHRWLSENGFGGLIKTEVVVAFDRDEHDAAMAAADTITEATGRTAAVNEKVHPQTLKAFLKEQLALGASVPFDLFGVRPYAKAKLTQPKAK
jgi:hypothetical protein